MRNLVIGTVAALVLGATPGVAAAAPPENTAPPTLSGTAREGSTLTAARGTWTNSPTTYLYTWQRCESDGTDCANIQGATGSIYTVADADVGRTVRVLVTAVNADGRDSAPSDPTGVVSSRNGPTNTARPDVSGDATVGGQLEVSTGAWRPVPTSLVYQWQRCDTDGTNCLNVAGATGQTYGVRAADLGSRLRALVTAVTRAGERATAVSTSSGIVLSDDPPTTTNAAPTIRFVALRRVGVRVYARFRVCDDGMGRVTVVQRDRKTRVQGFTRRFAVRVAAGCGSFTRSWIPAQRFRTPGRHIVTLQAIDTSRKISRTVSKSLVRR